VFRFLEHNYATRNTRRFLKLNLYDSTAKRSTVFPSGLKTEFFNALSLKLSHYDDKVGDFSFASRKNSVFAVESYIKLTYFIAYGDNVL